MIRICCMISFLTICSECHNRVAARETEATRAIGFVSRRISNSSSQFKITKYCRSLASILIQPLYFCRSSLINRSALALQSRIISSKLCLCQDQSFSIDLCLSSCRPGALQSISPRISLITKFESLNMITSILVWSVNKSSIKASLNVLHRWHLNEGQIHKQPQPYILVITTRTRSMLPSISLLWQTRQN